MANRLTDINVTEVSGVDRAANKRRFLLFKREGGDESQMDKADKPMKTEDGKQYPAEAYLYVPDPEKPSTWKLRIWEDPEKKVTAAQVGRAIAALSPGGFRGNRVDIPEDEIPKIKAKLRRLWREVNPDKDESEMPETIKKQGFLSRIAEGLKSMFKAEGQSFAENMVEANLREHFWRATDALRFAIENVMADEELTVADKSAKVAEALGQFQEYVMGLISTGPVSKIGAKISSARLERLKQAQSLLAEIIAEADGAMDEKGDEGVSKEEIAKMVEEALKPVVERLEKLEKPEDAGKTADPNQTAAADQVKKEDVQAIVTEAVNKALEPVLQRLEVVEKTKGVRKSVDGQDDPDGGKKSMWKGIL